MPTDACARGHGFTNFGANTYFYNDFAALDSIIAPHNDVYRTKYDLKGQIDSLILGTGVKEKRIYDDDGRMTSRNRISTFGTLGTLVSNVFGYDRMNRITSVSEQVAQQGTEQSLISYDGLGAVLAKEQSIAAGGARAEEFRNDAFGNVIRRRTRRTAGLINDVPFRNQYSVIGELTNSFAQVSNPAGQNEREDELEQAFASRGQLVRQDQLVRVPNGAVTSHVAGRHYYGADDKLMAVQLYSYRSTGARDGTREEYRYDALGRRIMTRARRDTSGAYPGASPGLLCTGTNICRSYKERVSWDGDQALVEDRTPEFTPTDRSNSGVVRNVHGLTLDEPLSVSRGRELPVRLASAGLSPLLPRASVLLDSLNFAGLRRMLRMIQIPRELEIQPEVYRRVEELGESHRGVGCDRTLFANDLIDSLKWNPESLGELYL